MTTELPKRKLRDYKTGILIILGIPLLLALFLWILDGLGAAALNKAVRQSRDMGGLLTLTEVFEARRKWPDDANGANVILGIKPQVEQVTQSDKTEGLPILDYKVKPELGHRWSPEMILRAKTYLETAQAELDQIDTLRRYEGGAFPITLAEDPAATLLPHLSWVRASARLKSLQTQYRSMQGDTSRLADDLHVLLCHGRLLADEPVLISSLVQRACDSLALRTLEQALGLGEISAADLARIQPALVAEDPQEWIERSIRSERAFFLAAADYFRATGSLAGSGGGSFPGTRIPGAQGWLMQDEAHGLTRFNHMIAAGDPRETLRRSTEVEKELASAGQLSGILTRSLMPSLTRAIGLLMRSAAEMDCARTAVAAERYRLANGRWPARLDELVPAYLDGMPEDPFTAQPIRMIAADGRFVVYSVGPDTQDNQGRVLRGQQENDSPDCGFILLDPDRRNQPPVPESAPAESQPAVMPIGSG